MGEGWSGELVQPQLARWNKKKCYFTHARVIQQHDWGLQCELFTPGKEYGFRAGKYFIYDDIEHGYVFKQPPYAGGTRLESLDKMRAEGFTDDDLHALGLV